MTSIVVYHDFYGCDTGCCGHRIEAGNNVDFGFSFAHPYLYNLLTNEETRKFITQIVTEELGADHVKDIDFDQCIILDD
jgi:hypothetical protein